MNTDKLEQYLDELSDGTDFSLVSADYLRFRPKKILE